MLACCACFESKPSSDDSNAGTIGHKALSELIQFGEIRTDVDSFMRGSVEWAYAEIKRVFDTNPGGLHVFDFKSLSDGDKNYWPQLCGYERPLLVNKLDYDPLVIQSEYKVFCDFPEYFGTVDAFFGAADDKAMLYVLHGKSRTTESREVSYHECKDVANHVYRQFTNPNKTPFSCEWCSLCSRLTDCPETKRNAEAVLVAANDDTFDLAAVRDVTALTDPSMAARMLFACKQAKSFIEAVEDRCKELAKDGPLVFGDIRYELKPKKGAKVVVDIDAAFTRSTLDAKDFYKACKVSIPELCKAYASAKGVKQKDADLFIKAALGDAVVEMPGTQTLEKVRV